MRKAFSTSIDIDVTKEFKVACVQNDVNMNDVLEELMKMYTEGKIIVTLSKVESDKK